jgi:hypothetical protein
MSIRQLSESDVSDWKSVRLEAVKLHPEAFGGSFEEEHLKSNSEFAEGLRNGFEIYGTELRSLKVGQTFYDEHLMVRRFESP